MMRRCKGKIMVIVVFIIILIVVIYLFTPIGFGRLSLKGEYDVKITVNGRTLTATMVNNSSSQAFKKMLLKRPKTIRMRDYASMEKVGMLWKGLPTNNESITAKPGDIILYMGNSIVVYYNQNSWNFTKLGHINDATQEELKEILGNGNVTMTFELLDKKQ